MRTKTTGVLEVAEHVLFWLPPATVPAMPEGEWVLQRRPDYEAAHVVKGMMDRFAGHAEVDVTELAAWAAGVLGYPVTLVRDADEVLTPSKFHVAVGDGTVAPVYLITPA